MKSKLKAPPRLPTSATPHVVRRSTRKLPLVLGVLLLLCIIGSLVLVSYQALSTQYQQNTALANAGIQHLQQAGTLLKGLAQHPLETKSITAAQHEFALAGSDFVHLSNNLQLLSGPGPQLPGYGRQIKAMFTLLAAALDVAHAGESGCMLLNSLISKVQNPLNSQLTATDLITLKKNGQQVVATLSQALNLLSQVQEDDVSFNARLSTMVASVHADTPALRQWLGSIEQFLPSLPDLLGVSTPSYYLIEILDSSELRPGGGFIGNYGIATLAGGRLVDARITDIDLLDRPFEAKGHTIPYPSTYAWFPLARESWSFRDSNLDADFPTAAQFGEQNYWREGGNLPVQGVIAITPMLIQQAFSITGPIYVPEYKETITAQNIIARIHYHQLGRAGEGPDTIASPDGHSSLRKRFTELLAEHFLARVHQLPSVSMPKFLQVLVGGLRTKDVQIYFNASEAEKLLHLAQVDSSIAVSPGDSLMVVDANVSPNKANSFIHYTLDEQVTLDEQGSATHRTTLTYAWTINGVNYGQPVYRDYVRVYVPSTAILVQENGLASPHTGNGFGHRVWSGFLYLRHGQVHSLTFTWQVPHIATRGAMGWQYQYEIERQAGILWLVHQQITFPAHATIVSTQAGLSRINAHQVGSTYPLEENRSMLVSYVGDKTGGGND